MSDKVKLPKGLNHLSIVKGELIIRVDSIWHDLIKIKVEDIREIFSRDKKITFVLTNDKKIESTLRDTSELQKVSDLIIEETLKHLTPQYI